MATMQPDTDLLTIAEAARILKVSTVTLQRWIKQGRIPAYRLGPRYIRIRRRDLDSVLAPVPTENIADLKEAYRVRTDLNVEPLTEEEIERGLKAIEELRRLNEAILARRGGKPFPSSWQLIREEREKRSRHLAGQ